jgi:Big-like domain-containing protein/hemolysin type calcium-binding protein
MPRLVVAALAAALFLAAPAAAHAAAVTVSNGALTYTAQARATNRVAFAETAPGTVSVTTLPGDNDPAAGAGSCSSANNVIRCTGVTAVVVDAGDGDDSISAAGLATIPATLQGGAGSDTLTGGAGDDAIDGGADNDVLNGGDGIDTAFYGSRTAPSYSIDGVANDGSAGEGDDIAADVENVTASAAADGTVSIAGSAGPNRLVVTQGKATIFGGAGADVLEGGPQDDVIDARDGTADVVTCGGGSDTVYADTVDSVSPTCEAVQRFATPGGPDDDHAPSVAWRAPRAGATISGSTPTTLSVTARDDRGVAKVDFYAGRRRVCEDTAAPFTCPYAAHGADVGRTTLVAVAFDGANQTATVWRAVKVLKFRTRSLSLAARPARDRRAPFSFRLSGKIALPAHVSAGEGCQGTVTVTAEAGGRTVSRRHVALQGRCGYRLRLRYARRPAASLRLTARFSGNGVMHARTSHRHTLRLH